MKVVLVFLLRAYSFSKDRKRTGIRMMNQKDNNRTKGRNHENRDRKEETVEREFHSGMFWLRCMVAMALFACVVLADYNHASYNGITADTIKEQLADTGMLASVKAFLVKYIQ